MASSKIYHSAVNSRPLACVSTSQMLVKGSVSRALLLTAALISICASSGVGQQRPIKRLDGSTITSAEIDATVTRLMRAAEVPGVGIAIFNNDRIVYLKAYGLRDKEKNLPLTPDSVMTSASLSKSAFRHRGDAVGRARRAEPGQAGLSIPAQAAAGLSVLPRFGRRSALQADHVAYVAGPHQRLSQLARRSMTITS